MYFVDKQRQITVIDCDCYAQKAMFGTSSPPGTLLWREQLLHARTLSTDNRLTGSWQFLQTRHKKPKLSCLNLQVFGNLLDFTSWISSVCYHCWRVRDKMLLATCWWYSSIQLARCLRLSYFRLVDGMRYLIPNWFAGEYSSCVLLDGL